VSWRVDCKAADDIMGLSWLHIGDALVVLESPTSY